MRPGSLEHLTSSRILSSCQNSRRAPSKAKSYLKFVCTLTKERVFQSETGPSSGGWSADPIDPSSGCTTGLKHLQPIRSTTGLYMECRIGVKVFLGEMDVAQVKPPWLGYVPSAQGNRVTSRQQAAVTNFRGATRGPSHTQWTTSTRLGLHRALGVEDETWR